MKKRAAVPTHDIVNLELWFGPEESEGENVERDPDGYEQLAALMAEGYQFVGLVQPVPTAEGPTPPVAILGRPSGYREIEIDMPDEPAIQGVPGVLVGPGTKARA